jgi:predicted Fe-Mo cluster-binding NifX family protein
MRIAVPVVAGKLAMHFGHCEQFALIDVDVTTKEISHQEAIDAPPHEPGLLPQWLATKGANLVIAGGMGGRALQLFAEQGIEVVVGAGESSPEEIARDYLDGKLRTASNLCDH